MKRALSVAIAILTVACSSIAAQEKKPVAPVPTQPVGATVTLQTTAVPAQPRPEDVDSIEHIIASVYDVISGPKGKARDWNRFRSLFHPNARLIPTGPRKEGGHAARAISPEEYIERSGAFLVNEGFQEKNIANRVERFGHIAHVFSSYQAFKGEEKTPFMRGINSIQLVNDGTRWWVITIFWEQESPTNPIPDKYLKK